MCRCQVFQQAKSKNIFLRQAAVQAGVATASTLERGQGISFPRPANDAKPSFPCAATRPTFGIQAARAANIPTRSAAPYSNGAHDVRMSLYHQKAQPTSGVSASRELDRRAEASKMLWEKGSPSVPVAEIPRRTPLSVHAAHGAQSVSAKAPGFTSTPCRARPHHGSMLPQQYSSSRSCSGCMTALPVYGTRGAPDLIVGTVGCGLVAAQAGRGCPVLALNGRLGLYAQLCFQCASLFESG